MPRGTTPFIRKTWELLSDKALVHVVAWNRNGETFAILDADAFSADVLPQYFKHSNLCSFVRQLNTYGFKKVTSKDCKELEFKHKLFHRDHEELLPHIVRRTANSKASADEMSTTAAQRDDLLQQLVETNKQLVERLNELKKQQQAADADLCSMRKELNETRAFVHSLSTPFQWKAEPTWTPPPRRMSGAAPAMARTRVCSFPPTGERQSTFGFNTSPSDSGDSSPEAQPSPNAPLAALPLNADLEVDFENDFFTSL